METHTVNALIICHGDPPSEKLLRREVAGADLVVCTDGVASWLEGLGIVIDLVVGDMDSLGEASVSAPLLDAGPHEAQHNSDSEKAILACLERGATCITLLGALGGRLDHSLGNIALLAAYMDRARLRMMDDANLLEVVRGRRRFAVSTGARVSLISLTDDVELVTHGLQWELSEALELGTRGLSNRATGEQVEIDVTRGAVAVVILGDD